MATKRKTRRKTTRCGLGKLNATLFSDEYAWALDGEMLTSAEADLRGLANDTPFRISGADCVVQLDKTES